MNAAKQKTLSAIHNGACSVAQIASASGLSKATVRKWARLLTQDGLVREDYSQYYRGYTYTPKGS